MGASKLRELSVKLVVSRGLTAEFTELRASLHFELVILFFFFLT